jgi:hypothetical protein
MTHRVVLSLICAAVGLAVLMPGAVAATPTPMLTQPVPTLSAADLFGKTPGAFQYRVLRSLRQLALLDAPEKRARFGVGYEDFDFGTLSGNAWTFDVGFERTQSPWGWGLLSPSQVWDIDGFDDLLQIGLAPYVFTYINETIRLSGFGEIDMTNSDIAGIGDETSYGLGGSASALFKAGGAVTIAPIGMVQYYATGQEGQDDSLALMLGANLDVVLGEQFDIDVYGFYTYENQNDDLDDSFFEYGASFTFTISEGWGVTVGYEATASADEYDAGRLYVNGQYDF